MQKLRLITLTCTMLCLLQAQNGFAQTQSTQVSENAGIFQYLLNQFSGPENHSHVYGVIETNLQKSSDYPEGINEAGSTTYESDAHQYSIPHAHLMLQSMKGNLFNGFLNLNINGEDGIDVNNAWMEIGLNGEMLKLRLGKLYRPFGLYNEVRDSVTTRLSTELPEYLGENHAMISPTTNLMLHGRISGSGHTLRYAFTTGNDLRARSQTPFGTDIYYIYNNFFRFGASYYSSNGNAVAPSTEIGELKNSPVQNWMDKDQFNVYGSYMRLAHMGFNLDLEYWTSSHKAERDIDQIQALEAATYLNPTQLQRFGLDGITGQSSADDSIPLQTSYTVSSYLMRLAYTWETEFGFVTPYINYDYYKNPETIAAKEFGGDEKAGRSQDGKFEKFSFGLIFKPIPAIAIKAEYDSNRVKFNNQSVLYSSYLMSAAYFWELN